MRWTLAAACVALAFLAVAAGILLDRTYGLREVVEPTIPWRNATDARLAAVETRLDLLGAQAAEVETRATNLEGLLEALRAAREGSHGTGR